MLFLNYLITFLDNEIEVYDTLENTFCGESIINNNSCFKLSLHYRYYEIILEDDQCHILYPKNIFDKASPNIAALKRYVEQEFVKIMNLDSEQYRHLLKSVYFNYQAYRRFYVTEIHFAIKKALFKKITNDEFNFKKNYEIHEIITILIKCLYKELDNGLILMKNLLHIIFYDYGSMYKMNIKALKYLLQQHVKTEIDDFYEQLIALLIKDDIVTSIHTLIGSKMFLDEFQNEKLLNSMFEFFECSTDFENFLFKKFYFEISLDEQEELLRIKNDESATYPFTIHESDIDLVSAFLSKNYILYLVKINKFILRKTELLILKMKSKSYQIDISQLYLNLYAMKYSEIRGQNDLLNQLIINVTKNAEDCLFLLINQYKLKIKFLSEKAYDIKDVSFKNDKNINTTLFVAKYILSDEECLTYEFIKRVSETIIMNYIKLCGKIKSTSCCIRVDDSSEQIKSAKTEIIAKPFFCSHEIHNLTFNSNENYHIMATKKMNEIKSNFCGIRCNSKSIKLQSECRGIIDQNFILVEINHKKKRIGFPDLSSFVHETVIQKPILSAVVNLNEHQENVDNFLDAFFIELCSLKFIKTPGHPFSLGIAVKVDESDLRPALKIEIQNFHFRYVNPVLHTYEGNVLKYIKNRKVANQKIATIRKIYREALQPEKRVNLPFVQPNEKSHHFFVMKESEFHLLILRFLIVQSNLPGKSWLYIHYRKNEDFLHIKHCNCQFLAQIPSSISDLDFDDVFILEPLFLKQSDFERNRKQLCFSNFNSQTINFLEFAIIKEISSHAYLKIEKNMNFYDLVMKNCSIAFTSRVPEFIKEIEFTGCVIQVDVQPRYNNPDESLKSLSFSLESTSLLSAQSTMHSYLTAQDYDIPGALSIDYHSTTVILNDQLNEFSIKGYLIGASSKRSTSFFKISKLCLICMHYEIECLQNIEVDCIFIYRSKINSIENLKTKELRIHWSKCTFELKDGPRKIKYDNVIKNLSITRKYNLILN